MSHLQNQLNKLINEFEKEITKKLLCCFYVTDNASTLALKEASSCEVLTDTRYGTDICVRHQTHL